MVVTPWHHHNGDDGPCNTDEMRKAFRTDVLKSLTSSYGLLFEKARQHNRDMKELSETYPDLSGYILDLEERISEITASFS